MKTKTKISILSMTLVFLFLMSSSLVLAHSPTQTTRGFANGKEYTQTIGDLGGATYVIRIPDEWNGGLIIGCHAYNHLQMPDPEFQFDSLASVFIAQGYAYAASDYGSTGYCIHDAVIRTHQLTEYVINNYGIVGKVFIFGGSMGGEVALLLGEKYPELYSGVLDICGPKDVVVAYNDASLIASMTLDQIRAALGWPSLVPDATVQGFKDFCSTFVSDVKAETGGTPETKPKAYQRISPVNHTDISIPVISLVGGADFIVPIKQTTEYQNAVNQAGQSSLYKVIVVPDGGHIDTKTLAQAPSALSQLISWSDQISPRTQIYYPNSFGNKNTGTIWDQNDAHAKSASYFICGHTGTITDIFAYVARVGTKGDCAAAIYADNGGSPGALIATTNQVKVGTSFSWVDFKLPSPVSVTSGTGYWLALSSNNALNLNVVAGSGVRVHNSASSWFSDPFGPIWDVHDAGAMSIYATGLYTQP